MKKLLFLFVFIPFCAFAQVGLGIKAGGSINSAPFINSSNPNGDIGSGYVVGLKAMFLSSKKVQVGIGVDAVRLATAYDNVVYNPDINTYDNYTNRLILGNPAIAPQLIVNLNGGQHYFGLSTGPVISLVTNKEYSYDYLSNNIVQTATTYRRYGLMGDLHYGFMIPLSARTALNPEIALRAYMIAYNGALYTTIALPVTIGITTFR